LAGVAASLELEPGVEAKAGVEVEVDVDVDAAGLIGVEFALMAEARCINFRLRVEEESDMVRNGEV
jgi:hypothetical protein